MSENSYSNFVSYAKVILPLAALALLSTLFLFARGNSTGDVPYADIEEIAREPRLTDANFAGMTNNGSSFAVTAAVARPDTTNPSNITVEKIDVDLQSAGGPTIDVSAGIGKVDTQAQVVTLDDLARVNTSSGYLMETNGLVVDIRAGTLVTTAPLEIHAPYGELTAGKMTITADGENAQMVFNEGVRLIYQPRN